MCQDLQIQTYDIWDSCVSFPCWNQIYIEFFGISWDLVKNKSCLLGILKAWDPFINHMTISFKQLVSNIKLDRTLEYIILKALEMNTPIHKKIIKLCYMDKKMLHFKLLLTS
jgi:hypothetical protein